MQKLFFHDAACRFTNMKHSIPMARKNPRTDKNSLNYSKYKGIFSEFLRY